MNESKKIVILLYQFSVVVKGIERKLVELGYNVEILTEDFAKIEEAVADTDLFLLYLPADITDDFGKVKILEEICKTIKKYNQKMIILGEKKYHPDLMRTLPLINDFGWMDRPIDNNELGMAVDKAISGSGLVGVLKRILIIDDDSSYAGMVKEWIKDLYKTDIVTDGLQGIKFLMKKPVDLVLLDYEMPEVDGPMVLERLRQVPQTQDIPVVFLTGVGTKEHVARVMGLKPNGYILKTTTRENLLEYIKSKLD